MLLVSFGAGGEPVRVSGRGLSWWQLRYAHLVAIRSWLLERGLAPASVNLHLVALRRVLKECWRLGHLSGEDYQRAAAVPGVVGSRLPAGRSRARPAGSMPRRYGGWDPRRRRARHPLHGGAASRRAHRPQYRRWPRCTPSSSRAAGTRPATGPATPSPTATTPWARPATHPPAATGCSRLRPRRPPGTPSPPPCRPAPAAPACTT